MTLGERILNYRKERELSQENLGEALGVSRQAVSKWESDAGIPELDTLIAMSRLFGVSLGQLLGVEGDGFPPLNDPAGGTEELLRQYSEAAEKQRARQKKKNLLGIAVGSCVAAVALLWGGVFLAGHFQALARTTGSLEDRISVLEEQLNAQEPWAQPDQTILTEEERRDLFFKWDVLDFDLSTRTLLLRLRTGLEDHQPEESVQFVVDWMDPDRETSGQVRSAILTEPVFMDVVEIPMNTDLQISMLIRDGSETVVEHPLTSLYREFEEETFSLGTEDSIWPLFGLSIAGAPQRTETAELNITSSYPELIAPVSGRITVTVYSGETDSDRVQETFPLLMQPVAQGVWQADLIEASAPGYDLREGENIHFVLELTDNRGRSVSITEGFSMEHGEITQSRSQT